MRFTDRFFSFPIKVYNAQDISDLGIEGLGGADWVVGQLRLPREALDELIWYDGYDKTRLAEDVFKKGFDMTIVSHPVHGDFNCVWTRDKFEKKLDEFVERVDVPQRLDYQVQDPAVVLTPNPLPYK